MKKRVIPLSSDTETKPVPGMRRAMAGARVGDEQKGRDPTVNELLDRVCALLGKDDALFLPTGTMCNLVAVKAHTNPGDVILADRMAHVFRAESGGAALTSGVMTQPVWSSHGIFDLLALNQAVAELGRVPRPHAPPYTLLCIEQTHNLGGGTLWPLDELRRVSDRARELGMALHMDGARLFNAQVASRVPVRDFADCVDSVWIDFSKGLGAPMGAVLAGPSDFIVRARRLKHLFGGAMRQAGIIAAGCLYALDHHVERLGEDHRRARLLAEGLGRIDGIRVRNPEPETNIVIFDLEGPKWTPEAFLEEIGARGLEMSGVAGGVRAVTHLDVSTEDVERAIGIVGGVMKECR